MPNASSPTPDTPTSLSTSATSIWQTLEQTITERLQQDNADSYVASLANKGLDQVLKKIGEEATELVIAGKSANRDDMVYETSDLLFHVLILLAVSDVSWSAVEAELSRRLGISGIAEKNARTTKSNTDKD